jgi:predicted permease
MTGLFQDVSYSFRQIRSARGFAAAAIFTLALGMSANSTIFSWIQATLLTPIPAVTHTGDFFSVERGEPNENPNAPFSYRDLQDVQQGNRTLVGMLGYHDDWMSLTGTGKPVRAYGALTTANYFDLLGIRPNPGRGFLPQEEQLAGGANVVVISYTLWKTRFEGDPAIVGRTLEINHHPFTIVGVAPEAFIGCKTGMRTDLWTPLTNDAVVWGGNRILYRDAQWLNVLGKLRQGVTRGVAGSELNRLMQQIATEYPDTHRGPNTLSLYPLWRSPFGANVYLVSTLPLLLGLAGLVLLLACANVATLLLARSINRRREIAIRLALGASRARLIRQLLMESLLLSFAAGILAMILTTWTAGTFASFIPPTRSPITLNGRVDGIVLLASFLMSGVAGLLFGLLPAVRASRLAPMEVLKQEAGSVSATAGKARLSSGLVVAQIALSLVLLVCAALFLRTLHNTEHADPGFTASHLLLASFDLDSGYSREAVITFQRQLATQLAELPGVDSFALADWVPLTLSRHTDDIVPEGYLPRLHESMATQRAAVTPNYFQTMRTAMLSGRDFTPQDDDHSQPVAIVDQTMANIYWPRESALGHALRIQNRRCMIVGVVRNSRHYRMNETLNPLVYLSLYQFPTRQSIIHLRTSANPQSMASTVEAAVHALGSDVPVFDVMSFETSRRVSSIFARVGGVFVGGFGLIALVLAAVGIYGVVAYSTRQRMHEIGIRIALGASRTQILQLVVGQGVRLILAGLTIGLAASFGVARLLRNALYGISATDSLTLIGVSLLLAAVGLLACYQPTRRAMRIDPTMAMRAE